MMETVREDLLALIESEDNAEGIRALLETVSKEQAREIICREDDVGWDILDVGAYMRRREIVRILLEYVTPRIYGEGGKDPFQTAYMCAYK